MLGVVSGSRHSDPESPFAAVVVVGSLGALQAFGAILGCLPSGFPAAIVFGLHRGNTHGLTEELLARRGNLPVRTARDGLLLAPATVYLAPWNRQLLLAAGGAMRIVPGAAGTGHRFADALLRSAAQAFGSRLIAVVLSGRLNGGADGAREVKRLGGRVLAQAPGTAVAPSMPTAALASGCVDFALGPEALAHALVALCSSPGAAELFRVRLNAGVRS
jgi:two-component system chemotaxis response regulator CheB